MEEVTTKQLMNAIEKQEKTTDQIKVVLEKQEQTTNQLMDYLIRVDQKIDALDKKFESKFTVLDGPDGCGKSTLLDLLVSLRKPAAGSIRYNERDLSTYSKRR